MRTIAGVYAVIRLLGRGGMSEVYEVEHLRLGSRHALKLFNYSGDDHEVRDRFVQEARILARLSHPRIVKVTDFGTDDESGRPYFVMELVLDPRGEPRALADVEPGTADEDEIGRWYEDLREGLAYIHGQGVVHRDLKLDNVLIGPDGHAVLTDFGVSKVTAASPQGEPIVDPVKTLVRLRENRRLVMGSIGYMAPEVEMGVAASPQSDWYALGVIVYRLLTGMWCDSRTDVVGVLETYDPAWRRILPKLLHANPAGRECLSFAAERRLDRERAACAADERILTLEGVRRRLAFALIAAGALIVFGAVFAVRTAGTRGAASVTFDEVFAVPEFSSETDEALDGSELTLDDYADMWKRTLPLFRNLNAGLADVELTRHELERLGREEFDYIDDSALGGCYFRAASNLVERAAR